MRKEAPGGDGGRGDALPPRPRLWRAGLGGAGAVALVALLVGAPDARATGPPASAAAPGSRVNVRDVVPPGVGSDRAAARDTFVQGRYEGTHGSRSYRLWIPPGPAPEGGRPLVLMLHGCTQDAADFAAGTGLHRRVSEEGWLVLYPEQPADAHPQRCWRWYLPEHQTAGSGEPAILVGMVERIAGSHEVDPERIYVAGVSAGGAMAAVLAATRPDRFAAAAVHSGIAYGAARAPREALEVMRERGAGPEPAELARRLEEALEGHSPPPLLVIQGEEDRAVAPGNARRLAAAWLAAAGRDLPRDSARGERRAEGLLPSAVVDEEHDGADGYSWRRRAWEGPDHRVELRTVDELGHAWSGGDPAGSYTDPRGPSATAWVVDFFRDRTEGAGGSP